MNHAIKMSLLRRLSVLNLPAKNYASWQRPAVVLLLPFASRRGIWTEPVRNRELLNRTMMLGNALALLALLVSLAAVAGERSQVEWGSWRLVESHPLR